MWNHSSHGPRSTASGGMGALVSSKQRYMQGKVPSKYYADEVWPLMQDLFYKLGLDEAKGLELFLTFCKMDADAGGTLDVDEIFGYLGGVRTKFTERLWHAEDRFNDNGELKIGLEFKDFAIIVWNYCTLTPYYLARKVFEIFDVERVNNLERPDIETMYRMLYDCDDHDEYYVNQIVFNKENYITKDDFCEQVNRRRHIIEPCMNYQARLRRNMGGFIMWEALTGFRRRYFLPIDSNSATTDEAFRAILEQEDPNKNKRRRAADELLAEKKAKAAAEEAKAAAEVAAIEQEKARRLREAELKAEDRFMKEAWVALEKKRFEFEDLEFSVENAWERREKRMELYSLLDAFVETANEYFLMQDAKELKSTIGTDQDHEARYRDFMRTNEGTLLRNRTMATLIFKAQIAKMEEAREKKKHRITGLPKKSDVHSEIEGALQEIEKKVLREAHIKTLKASGASKRQLDAIKPVDYNDECKFMKALIKKPELRDFEEQTRLELFTAKRSLTISTAEASGQRKKEDRARDYVRIEFEMAGMYGARLTRYEQCRDYINNRDVYIDINTLEIIHIKTAICEMCDACFEQSDVKCKGCNGVRSAKNHKLYRPLGFKDIRIDD